MIILLLTLAMRQAVVMYNSHRLKSARQLFKTLYHPFDKLELVFEIFFYTMVLMDIAAAISGAASDLNTYVGLNYDVGIFAVGIFAIVIPFLTVGAYKNHQYMRENGEEFETC